MRRRLLTAVLFALLIPYVVTLAWTGRVEGKVTAPEYVSGRRILLDRGGPEAYVDVEEYLPGVVAGQMPVEYGEEALRAQAVIARTYIYKQMGEEKEIREAQLDMDVMGKKQMEQLWGSERFVSCYQMMEEAVRSTRCTTMTYDGTYIDPLFHRASAGSTRAGDEDHAYLQPVKSPKDVEADHYGTMISFSKEEFSQRISQIPGANQVTPEQVPETIQMIEKEEAGYVKAIQIGTKTYTGEEVQGALGLPSPCFVLEGYEGGIRAVCRGIGHGYGLSQYGAKVKAEEGWKAEDILAYFYKNIVLISE